jgi:hypothetical protein
MVYLDVAYITIHWDEHLKCVIMEWKRFVEGNDFKKGLNTGLELVQKNSARKWLADLRRLGVVTQEDQEWSNNDWFPRAISAGLTHMAIVVPHNIIAKWSVDRIMSKVAGTNLTTHYFDNVEQARDWLAAN